jgi:hypothetical protein
MGAFEVVVIIVAVVAAAGLIGGYLRRGRAVDHIGKGPGSFDHAEDHPVDERPSEDAMDAPLPDRPVRGRP